MGNYMCEFAKRSVYKIFHDASKIHIQLQKATWYNLPFHQFNIYSKHNTL